MKLLLTIANFVLMVVLSRAQSIIADKASVNSFSLSKAVIYIDKSDYPVVQKSAELLQKDIEMVTGKKPALVFELPLLTEDIIVIGSIEKSQAIGELIKNNKINISKIKNQWEGYQLQTISNPFKGVDNALVITGSERRGTAFGVFELSKLLTIQFPKPENMY